MMALLAAERGLPILPSRSGSYMLPGERCLWELDAELCRLPRKLSSCITPPAALREIIDDAGDRLVGQMLIMPNGNLVRTVPILLVAKTAKDSTHAEITCIGRGRLQLDQLTCGHWAHSDAGCRAANERVWVAKLPVGDHADVERCRDLSDAFNAARHLASRLSTVRQLSPIFARPLECTIEGMRHALSEALQRVDTGAGDWVSTSDARDELELISYAIARASFGPDEGMHALALTDGSKRRLYVETLLAGLEQRLAAETALLEWSNARCCE